MEEDVKRRRKSEHETNFFLALNIQAKPVWFLRGMLRFCSPVTFAYTITRPNTFLRIQKHFHMPIQERGA